MRCEAMIKLLRFTAGFRLVALPIALAVALMASTAAFGQESDDIEGLFNKDEQSTPELPPSGNEAAEAAAPGDLDTSSSSGANVKPGSRVKNTEIRDVSDLGKLSEFSDIAVIQRRFLPKTGRFEAFVAPSLVLNDAFFLNYGLTGRLGYSFSERFGVEAVGTYLLTSERGITTDLREKRAVVTTSLITPKSYLGVDFRWTPVYGKMTWLNQQIVPFDLYFSIGPGMTATNQGANEVSLHFGTGQIFARTKGSAFRWDFSWNVFQATAANAQVGSTDKAIYNTLFLSLGMSFFFPEATYR